MWQPSQQCVPNFTETFWKIYSHFLCSQFGFGGTWCSYILTLSSTFGMNLKTGSHPYHQHQWLTSLILLWLNENKISAVRCKNLVKSLEEKKKKNRRLLKVFAPCWIFLFKIIFFCIFDTFTCFRLSNNIWVNIEHTFCTRISFFILESGVQYHYPDLGLITVRPADSINHLNKSVWQI